MTSAIDLELEEGWQRPSGIFVIAEVRGAAGDAIRAIQERFDPKLARALPPHITIVGSSGLGPIAPSTSVEELVAALGPVCADSLPMELELDPPHRFMQTNIVVMPLAPHGQLRELHDRIGRSGLSFSQARFTFTPHVTLSFYRTLEKESLRELMSLRIDEPVRVDLLRCSLTSEPLPPRTLLELPLMGNAAEGHGTRNDAEAAGSVRPDVSDSALDRDEVTIHLKNAE